MKKKAVKLSVSVAVLSALLPLTLTAYTKEMNDHKEMTEEKHLVPGEVMSEINMTNEGTLSNGLPDPYAKIMPRSSSGGLVQFWQHVPSGQGRTEGVSDATILQALQCRPNHNLYGGSGKSSHDTYVNACYVDDALYLGEDATYFNVYVSGYEGKVPKKESHYFNLDLNKDGKSVRYEIQTVAYFIPGSGARQADKQAVQPDAHSLNFANDTLQKKLYVAPKSINLTSDWVVKSPSYYANEGGTLVHYISNNVRDTSYSKAYVGQAPQFMSANTRYYSYDNVYFYQDWRRIKVNGQGAINEKEPFYSYYQWLPVRSTTAYTSSHFNNFTTSYGYTDVSRSKLVNAGKYFQAVTGKYGINGALQYAMAIHESGWGTSSLSLNKNNLFGMNATDDNPYGNGTSFSSVESGINYHADIYLSQGYTDPLTDWRYMGPQVGNKGSGMNVRYASDPFWGEKIAGWYYRLDLKEGFKDHYSNQLGIKSSDAVVNVLSSPSSSAKTYYQTDNGRNGLKIYNYPITVTGSEGDYYEVQTDTPIINGKPQYSGIYKMESSRGYVPKASFMLVGEKTVPETPDVLPNSSTYVGQLRHMLLHGTLLTVRGFGQVQGWEMPTESSVLHELVMVNTETKEEIAHDLRALYGDWLSRDPFNMGGNYAYGEYEEAIDLSDIPFGTYELYHQVTVNNQVRREMLNNVEQVSLPKDVKNGSSYMTFETIRKGDVYSVIFEKTEIPYHYVGRMTALAIDGTMLNLSGYGELKGFEMPTADSVRHEMVLVNDETKAEQVYTLTAQYDDWLATDPHQLGGNYAYGQFKGQIDLQALPVGDYHMYHQMHVGGTTYRSLFVNSAYLKLPDEVVIEEAKVAVVSPPEQGVYPLRIKKSSEAHRYVGRFMSASFDKKTLIVNGYAELEGYDMPTPDSVVHRIILIDQETKKEMSYDAKAIYSSWLEGDPHQLGGNYAFGQYQLRLDTESLPKGRYDMYHEMTVRGMTYRHLLHNGAQVALPQPLSMGSEKVMLSSEAVQSQYPVILTKAYQSPQYIGRLVSLTPTRDGVRVEGYGEIKGLEMPTHESVKHELVFYDAGTQMAYSFLLTDIYSGWLENDPHKLGGNYAYGMYRQDISFYDMPSGDYEIYHQMTVAGQTHRELLFNGARIALPNTFKAANKVATFKDYAYDNNYPVRIILR